MDFKKSLQKIVDVFEEEGIPYMIVGGFAMSYYNRFRFTADIDCVVQIYPHDVKKIVKHFPDWLPFVDSYKENVERGILFNLTDFETGIKYDFMPYKDSDYNWTAFKRRRKVEFFGVNCFIAALEDLIIIELGRQAVSPSSTRIEDVRFLLNEDKLDGPYLELWSHRLNITRYGLF